MPGCMLAVLCALLIGACGDRTLQVVSDSLASRSGGNDSQAQDGGATGGSVDGSTASNPCPGGVCACNDGIDNDGDGVVDGLDPECIGPFDNDESAFGTGFGDGDLAACRDCFFDGNATTLDDSCNYDPSCTAGMGPTVVPETPNPSCDGCDVSASCVNSCRTRTPNGCDCFGCCEVYDKGKKPQKILMVEGCSLDNIDDRMACPRCTLNKDCKNECGDCELCIGKAPEDLDEKCAVDGGTPEYACGDGPRCGKKESCNPGFYCQQGCCIPFLY